MLCYNVVLILIVQQSDSDYRYTYNKILFHILLHYLGFPDGASGKEPACQCKRCKRHWFDPWVGKISWRRAWQPTSVFLPGQFHGQRSLGGCSPWGCKRIGHNLKETKQQQTVQPPLAWTREDSPLCPSPVHQAIFALAPDPSVPLAIPNDLCSQGNHDQFSCLSALFDLEDFFFFPVFYLLTSFSEDLARASPLPGSPP